MCEFDMDATQAMDDVMENVDVNVIPEAVQKTANPKMVMIGKIAVGGIVGLGVLTLAYKGAKWLIKKTLTDAEIEALAEKVVKKREREILDEDEPDVVDVENADEGYEED